MSTVLLTREVHLVRLAVHEVEDLADMLRTEARGPRSNAARYNTAMQGARWLEAKISGRSRIDPIDLALEGNDWNRIAQLCAASGLVTIARKIWTQIEMGE